METIYTTHVVTVLDDKTLKISAKPNDVMMLAGWYIVHRDDQGEYDIRQAWGRYSHIPKRAGILRAALIRAFDEHWRIAAELQKNWTVLYGSEVA